MADGDDTTDEQSDDKQSHGISAKIGNFFHRGISFSNHNHNHNHNHNSKNDRDVNQDPVDGSITHPIEAMGLGAGGATTATTTTTNNNNNVSVSKELIEGLMCRKKLIRK